MALVYDATGGGFYDTGTGALGLPRGTTAQRPANPLPGYMRFNTDINQVEIWGNTANTANANSWGILSTATYTAQVLIVAGGGAGSGPGAGAGGLIYNNSMVITAGQTLYVNIGGGGTAGARGYNTTFNGVTAIGGGGPGQTGGSGGGHWWNGHGQWGTHISGTAGQGYPGGCGYCNHDWGHSYGGGGGAGAQGGNGTGSPGGAGGSGGSGQPYSISGTSTYYAGGGGAGQGGRTHYGGGGAGGGGGSGAAGTPGTGGGGSNNNGGSGIVIISYQGAQRARGGIVTTAAGWTVHTFTSSENYYS